MSDIPEPNDVEVLLQRLSDLADAKDMKYSRAIQLGVLRGLLRSWSHSIPELNVKAKDILPDISKLV